MPGPITQRERRIQEVITTASAAFKKEGFDLSVEDAQLTVDNPPEREPFPIFIFLFAVLKDFLDTFDATGLGLIITIPLKILSLLVMVVWGFGKLKHGFWKKQFLRRIIAVQVVELIPFISIFPTNTIFILYVYNKEKAIVRLFDNLLNSLHDAGVKL